MTEVSMRGVWRAFRGTWALTGVDFEVEQGTAWGLIGRNGAGKTTLLRMIPALLHPTKGAVQVFGLDPWDHQEEVKQQLGYVSESDGYPPRIKVRDLIELCAALYPTWDAPMAKGLLDDFSLDPGRRVGNLSTGQQRQVALICAVCHRPRLLVLDEPAGSLDAVVRREFLEVVIDLLVDSGSTIVFSSHQFADVERIADHVFILHRGGMLAEGSVEAFAAGSCRVMVRGGELGERELASIDRCVRVRRRDDGFALTFNTGQDTAREMIQGALGGRAHIADIQHVSLEDLFVDWTGRAR
jgi:ABC-2 type transport system ATP-binding protein